MTPGISLRCEYQTMRKLPKTKCIVFGARTYQRYLHELIDMPLDVSEALRTAIVDLDEEHLNYKGGRVWKKPTIEYLDLIIADQIQRLPHVLRLSKKLQEFASLHWFLPATMVMCFAAMTLVAEKVLKTF